MADQRPDGGITSPHWPRNALGSTQREGILDISVGTVLTITTIIKLNYSVYSQQSAGSSDRSPQSSTESHFQDNGMHLRV